MSHVAKVEVEIGDLDALQAACESLGLTFDRQATRWRWYGRWVKDYHAGDAAYKHGIDPSRYGTSDAGVISVPGSAYDIGVYRHPTKAGKFSLVYDFFGPGREIDRQLGRGLPKLSQEYSRQVVKRHHVGRMRRLGYQYREKQLPDGSLQLVFTQM